MAIPAHLQQQESQLNLRPMHRDERAGHVAPPAVPQESSASGRRFWCRRPRHDTNIDVEPVLPGARRLSMGRHRLSAHDRDARKLYLPDGLIARTTRKDVYRSTILCIGEYRRSATSGGTHRDDSFRNSCMRLSPSRCDPRQVGYNANSYELRVHDLAAANGPTRTGRPDCVRPPLVQS